VQVSRVFGCITSYNFMKCYCDGAGGGCFIHFNLQITLPC
jgi:hypothetical protein